MDTIYSFLKHKIWKCDKIEYSPAVPDLLKPQGDPFFLKTSAGQSPLCPSQYSGKSHSLVESRHITPCCFSYSNGNKTHFRYICNYRRNLLGFHFVDTNFHSIFHIRAWCGFNFITVFIAGKISVVNYDIHTLQFSQHGPSAHCDSSFSLHVIGSQHGSLRHSSVEPQSHSSSSSTILLPQFRFISICNEEDLRLESMESDCCKGPKP